MPLLLLLFLLSFASLLKLAENKDPVATKAAEEDSIERSSSYNETPRKKGRSLNSAKKGGLAAG